MIKNLSILAIALINTINLFCQDINNIHFEQEGNMINIYYDLSGPDEYDISVFCSQDGGINWGTPLKQVSGAVDKGQKAGYNKKITWNVLAEQDKLQGDVKFQIKAVSRLFSGSSGTFVDGRDNKVYKWVKIGNQTWMAENLNYVTISGSWCYDNQLSNCATYGRLYNWDAAKTSCPNGWHLPADIEWMVLMDFLGGRSVAGYKMKATSGWNNGGNGFNPSGFMALPGGYRDSEGSFSSLGNNGCFWSSSISDAPTHVTLNWASWNFDLSGSNTYQGDGFSFRCLKD